MILTYVAVLSWVVALTKATVDLASPAVFDSNFYININRPVLPPSTPLTYDGARDHWLNHGIDMGLPASGEFHSVQYLARYPDLVNAFGAHNYSAAVIHYLTNGLSEKRLGYLEGCVSPDRWTISDERHRLFVTASRRMGGAIDSLVWDHFEFINAWDHARELQMTMIFAPNGLCFLAAEAGSHADGHLATTRTVIQKVEASGHTLKTQSLPAFSIPAGQSCLTGNTTLNTQDTYGRPISKEVTLKCPGVCQPCLHYRSNFIVGGTLPSYTMVVMEAPAAYLAENLTVIESLDPQSGAFVAHDDSLPVVLSTPDEQHAMGAFAPVCQDTDLPVKYEAFNFPNVVPPNSANKWNAAFRKNSTNIQGCMDVQLSYSVYICVGRRSDVKQCLMSLFRSVNELDQSGGGSCPAGGP